MRTIGKGYQSCCANSSFKTMLRVRAGDYFAGNSAYYAGATDTNRCTICDDTSMEGGWAHTLSSCFNPVIKGMRINRHNELVRMVRDAILHSKKGNAKVYADLAASRHDQPPPQVTDEEWDEVRVPPRPQRQAAMLWALRCGIILQQAMCQGRLGGAQARV